jgi:hypothetical protein
MSVRGVRYWVCSSSFLVGLAACSSLEESDRAQLTEHETTQEEAQALGSVLLFSELFSAPLSSAFTPTGTVRVAAGRLELVGEASVELQMPVGAHEDLALDFKRYVMEGSSLSVEWRDRGAWVTVDADSGGDPVWRSRKVRFSPEADGRPLRVRFRASGPETGVVRLDNVQISGEPRADVQGRIANLGYQRFAVEHQCGWAACCGTTAEEMPGWYPQFTFSMPESAGFDGRIIRLNDRRYRVVLQNDAAGGSCCHRSIAEARAAYPRLTLLAESQVTSYAGTVRLRDDGRYEIARTGGTVECCFDTDAAAQAAYPGSVFRIPRDVPRMDATVTQYAPDWFGFESIEQSGACCTSTLDELLESYGMYSFRLPTTPDALDQDYGCTADDPSQIFRGTLNVYSRDQLAGAAGYQCVAGSLNVNDYAGDITDLSALSNLREVRGSVRISAGALTSLSGLGLERVRRDIYVDASALTSLAGLESLASVGGSINVYSWNALTLEPLASLEYLGRALWVAGAPPEQVAELTGRIGAPNCQ